MPRPPRFGFSVAKPWGDSDRYDFIVDSGSHWWRVQVKSAYSCGKSGYAFRTSGNVESHIYTPEEIDFLVAYVVPEDIWYVFPIEMVRKHGNLRLFPAGQGHKAGYERYREAWCQMACPQDGRCKEEMQILRCCKTGRACPKKE